jgi:hypothetical protein
MESEYGFRIGDQVLYIKNEISEFYKPNKIYIVESVRYIDILVKSEIGISFWINVNSFKTLNQIRTEKLDKLYGKEDI